jgi:cleavage and polyadenylation specificity factor subunit 2
MSSELKFTPISGAKNSDPLCYLLEIDDVKLLLDCGWSDKFDVEELQQFRRQDLAIASAEYDTWLTKF